MLCSSSATNPPMISFLNPCYSVKACNADGTPPITFPTSPFPRGSLSSNHTAGLPHVRAYDIVSPQIIAGPTSQSGLCSLTPLVRNSLTIAITATSHLPPRVSSPCYPVFLRPSDIYLHFADFSVP